MMTLFNAEGAFAMGDLTYSMEMAEKSLPGVQLQLYYFSEIKLSPKAVFQHLAGTPLRAWLDGSGFVATPSKEEDEPVGPLRYVHGRSEVMKGRHYISTVLLAKLAGDTSEAAWMSAIPAIYKKFTALLDTSAKKSA